jgi:hypothetical protein
MGEYFKIVEDRLELEVQLWYLISHVSKKIESETQNRQFHLLLGLASKWKLNHPNPFIH